MDSNDPLIKYGPVIIPTCIIIYCLFVNYLEYLFYKDDNYE